MAKREIKTKKDVTPDIVDEVTTPEPVEDTKVEFVGTVTNCSRLNVRKEAKAKSDVITIVNANTNVSVNVEWGRDSAKDRDLLPATDIHSRRLS